MTTPEPTPSDDAVRFPSLESLRVAHTELLRDFRTDGGSAEMIARVEAFIQRGRATGALLDADADRWAAQSQLDYWATQLYQPDYEPPDATLDEFNPQLAPALDDSLCPYVGLDAFHEANESIFFGRRRLVSELIGKLKTTRFLAVLGSSGSGKSSVVRAGLVPELKKGGLPGSADWKYFPPMVPGSNPLINLARLLLPPDKNTVEAELEAESFRENPDYLAQIASERFGGTVVLVVDQFEEIFTLCTDEVARNRFVDNLIALCQAPEAEHRVIITMRSDFEMNIARMLPLQAMFEEDAVRITPLTASELRESIEAPAARIGLKFEEGVVTALLNDTLGEPAALPLLQFTLLKLWEKRERNRVTWEAYKKLGGGRQALARSADEFYNQLIPEEQVTMRRILLKMVRPGEGLEMTSNRVPIAYLYQKAEARDRIDRVLNRLIQARLVRASEGDMASDDQVEIAHEALVRNWPRLVEWLEEERAMLRQRQRLTTAAEEWQRLNGATAALWRRELLEEALRYDDLNDLERKFVRASNARQRRVRIAWIGGTIITITYLVIAAFIAQRNAAEAKQQAKLALASRLASQAQLMIETRSSKQTTAVLLAVRSMQLSPSVEASQILQNNTLASPIASMTHDDWVNSVAFSPDGKYVASVSDDSTARIWETATGKEIARMTHDDWVNSVAFSPDGKYVVSGSDDGTARVWEATTGKEIARMIHDDWVNFVAFSPDGKYVASGSDDGTARVWEAATGGEIARITYDYGLFSVAFSPDGQYVLSAGCDKTDNDNNCIQGTARVWEIATGTEIARVTHDGWINSVAFSPDGKYVASGSDDGTARVWEIATGKEIASMTHDDWVNSVAFSPDGKYVASGSDDSTARVWEATTGKEIARMTHDNWVDTVAFSPDGQYVLSAGCDKTDADFYCTQGTARVWEPATGKEVARMTHDGWINSAVFSPDGQYVSSAGCVLFDTGYYCRQGAALVWESATGKEVAHISHNGDIYSVAFSPDGKYVVSRSEDGTARVWETVTGKGATRMIHDDWVDSVAFSPDGNYVVSGSWDGTARVWETATGKEVARMTHDNYVNSVAFSPDGNYVVSAGCDKIDNDQNCTQGTARVWETATGKEVARITHDSYVNSGAFSPDGKYVVSAGCDKTDDNSYCTQSATRVWEATTGKEIARITHDGWIDPAVFSPDGKYVVSAGCEKINQEGICTQGTARVWESATGKEIARIILGSYVRSLAFSPDGQYVVSGNGDGTARVWGVTTGKEIARMTHDRWINSVAFSPDGQYVVSGSGDGTARVWETATGKEVARMTHDNYVNSVAFSLDGNYVVSGSDDSTARVWEATTGKEITRITRNYVVRSVAFSPNGQYVVSGSWDNTVQVSSWTPLESITSACSRLSRNLTSTEWKQYFGDEPYLAICPNLPIHSTVIAEAILPTLLDANDDNRVQKAIEISTDLLENNSPGDKLSEEAKILVKDTIQEQISRSVSFVDSSAIEPSLTLLEDAKMVGLEIDNAYELNAICWDGTLYGYVKEVFQYCEQAVALAPEDGDIRDSRGLARALTGDYAGAVEDFQFFVDLNENDESLIQQRRQWIIDLKAGKNPFTPEVLEILKGQ